MHLTYTCEIKLYNEKEIYIRQETRGVILLNFKTSYLKKNKIITNTKQIYVQLNKKKRTKKQKASEKRNRRRKKRRRKSRRRSGRRRSKRRSKRRSRGQENKIPPTLPPSLASFPPS